MKRSDLEHQVMNATQATEYNEQIRSEDTEHVSVHIAPILFGSGPWMGCPDMSTLPVDTIPFYATSVECFESTYPHKCAEKIKVTK